VETVDNRIEKCAHRMQSDARWIRNNPQEGPPVVLISSPEVTLVVTLTNQTIYLKCPACFDRLRSLVLTRSKPGSS